MDGFIGRSGLSVRTLYVREREINHLFGGVENVEILFLEKIFVEMKLLKSKKKTVDQIYLIAHTNGHFGQMWVFKPRIFNNFEIRFIFPSSGFLTFNYDLEQDYLFKRTCNISKRKKSYGPYGIIMNHIYEFYLFNLEKCVCWYPKMIKNDHRSIFSGQPVRFPVIRQIYLKAQVEIQGHVIAITLKINQKAKISIVKARIQSMKF